MQNPFKLILAIQGTSENMKGANLSPNFQYS